MTQSEAPHPEPIDARPAESRAGSLAESAASEDGGTRLDAPGATQALARVRARLQTWASEWQQALQVPPSPRTVRLLALACSALLLLALLPTLVNANHNSVGAASAPPTATPVPTATPLPSPTAMSGYQPLVDSGDGFVIQYPLAWTCSSSNPGIDCIDSPTAQNYRLQVQLPGNWTGANTSQDPGDAAVWVNYALSAFSDVPGRTYQRLSNADQPATIGGVAWQSGAAVVGIEPAGDNTGNNTGDSTSATVTPTAPLVRIRVQVYATLFNNRPYIIALYAADDQFATGSTRYFQPMLNSFAFLPADKAS